MKIRNSMNSPHGYSLIQDGTTGFAYMEKHSKCDHYIPNSSFPIGNGFNERTITKLSLRKSLL